MGGLEKVPGSRYGPGLTKHWEMEGDEPKGNDRLEIDSKLARIETDLRARGGGKGEGPMVLKGEVEKEYGKPTCFPPPREKGPPQKTVKEGTMHVK